MRQRFVNMEGNLLLAKATLLDPRFKKVAFLNNMASSGEQSLAQEMASVVSDAEEVATPLPEGNTLWQAFDAKIANRINSRQGMADCIFERRQYFEDQLIPRQNEPLEWWHENSNRYQGLSKLAKKYLCITATSVPSERLFSKAGELVSHKRSCLKPKNVDMLLFLNHNIV